ncbi:MAG TPA: hypothetical protein VK973_03980, partial [Arenicellales bacterium]|nr:hypothetical protein [Arenicellales bacterium]
MSAKKQGEAVVFKHRLAGAAVLIGFAVIVVPLLLGGPGPGDEQAVPEQGAESDQSDSRVFRSNITPIGGAT